MNNKYGSAFQLGRKEKPYLEVGIWHCGGCSTLELRLRRGPREGMRSGWIGLLAGSGLLRLVPRRRPPIRVRQVLLPKILSAHHGKREDAPGCCGAAWPQTAQPLPTKPPRMRLAVGRCTAEEELGLRERRRRTR
jgi:hypothetical protein